jgi:glutamate N-acetyltransferase / amino-acid N-acetyltransferase
MRLPHGFRASGVAAGIKMSGQPDLALIRADVPLRWALATTRNALRAPFIDRSRVLYDLAQPVRGLAINSGNANCATGDEGIRDDEAFAAEAARALGLERSGEVLTASTGVIGRRLPMERIRQAMPQAALALSEEAGGAAAAIMTTDTRPKLAAAELMGGARVIGIAKGSGMIHPDMATMLAFVMTDAAISQGQLRELWPRVVDVSFNQVTVDGDTSPNDMAVLLSSAVLEADLDEFAEALTGVCQDLAREIVRDGEGATKLIAVQVRGARDTLEARLAARAVARSPLVKSAAHGNDPNWGRILVALGYCGASLDLEGLGVKIQGVEIYRGRPQPFDADELSRKMDQGELVLEVDLAVGEASGAAWGCDLSADYVRINADYHT